MWRFVHLSDPHLASTRDGVWNNRFLCTMMPDVMECLGRDLRELSPEFILATGDIASTQTRAAMGEARELMDGLGIPYYPMGGNHDFVLLESREWFLEQFEPRLPVRRTYYAFRHRNLRFIVLDAWWLWSDGTLSEVSEKSVAQKLDTGLNGARWAVPPSQLEWLEEELARHSDEPTLLALHYPLVEVPLRLLRPGLNNGGYLDNGTLLLDLLADFPQVKAVFSGHVHMNFVERAGSITQVVTGALPEFPTEYRLVTVFEDRLEIETRGLSDPSFAERSLIPGKEFTAGESEDRVCTIPLR